MPFRLPRFALLILVAGLLAGWRAQPCVAQTTPQIRSLHRAVTERYPSPQFHVNRYSIVPYQAKAFAVTTDGDVSAVWERIGGRWSWVLAYTRSQDQGAIDYAFREARFSSAMQARLGGRKSAPIHYHRF